MRMKPTGLALALFIPLTLFSPAEGAELRIKVHEFVCRDGRHYVKFGLINTYSYNLRSIVAFKITRNEEVLDCKSVDLDVATGEDGSLSHQVLFDLTCGQNEATSLQYRVFDRRDRSQVGVWLADCPSKEAPPAE